MEKMKKKVLIMAGYYVPSVKGGGPIQSIKNLVDNLSDKIDFYIVAADRDLGDDNPFENIKVDEWIKVGEANVFYTNKSLLTWKKVQDLICCIDYNVLYLCSFFAYKDSIIPIILNKINRISPKKIIVSPRGQFSKGALSLKSFKKLMYLKLSKFLGLYSGITWHATTDIEKTDIQKIFGTNINIKIAGNLTKNYQNVIYNKSLAKIPGELKIVYISRIHPMKNLLQVLELLKKINKKIEFSIYGPVEDGYYWGKCKEAIKQLPKNIIVNYYGLISNEKVNEIYDKNHIFILLTLGENFGHAISEALIGGCPVVISDRTPWRELETHQVGWDVPLENEKVIVNVLKECVEMDNPKYQEMSMNAYLFSKNISNSQKRIRTYLEMFS
jgi:glycosyltransferase involved in cell wall biosynthesis